MNTKPDPVRSEPSSGLRAAFERVRAYAKKILGRYGNRWAIGQFILLLTLAETLPADIFDQVPLLKSLCAPIVAIIPNISGYVSRSTFPQVAELIICLGWLIAPFNVIFGVLLAEPMTLEAVKKNALRMDIKFSHTVIASLLFMVAIPLGIWIFLTVPLFGPDSGASATDYSYNYRFVFGIVGQGMSNLMGYVIAIWIALITRFLPLLFQE